MAKKYFRKNSVENYAKRHDFLRRWLSAMLVLALLITTVTLYAMNKSASAVTEEGAEEVGMVLNSDSSEGVNEDESASDEESSEESSDETQEEVVEEEQSENTEVEEEQLNDDVQDGQEENTADSEESTDSTETDAAESNSVENEGTESEGENAENSGENVDSVENTENSEAAETEEAGETSESDELALKSGEEGSEEVRAGSIELTADVKLTVSYVDDNGELIKDEEGNALADEKEVNLSEGLVLTAESGDVREIEGYTYAYSTLDDVPVIGITVKTTGEAEESSGFKYYEATDSNGNVYDVTADAKLVIAYLKSDEEKTENSGKKSKVIIDDVTMKAIYVNSAGEHIKDDQKLEIGENLDFSKPETMEKLEGYFFKEVTYQDKKVASVNIVEKEITDEMIDRAIENGMVVELNDKEESESLEAGTEEASAENTEESSSETDGASNAESSSTGRNIVTIVVDEDGTRTIEEGSATTYKTYEVVTANGETIEVTEDSEIAFVYLNVNTQEVFEVKGDKVTVTAKLSNPASLPEGVELIVTEISEESSGYNYDAYLQAMNDNAENIAQAAGQETAQTYDKSNTLIYDICFKLDGVEYQPEEGSVSVSIQLNDNQISDGLGAENSDDVTVIHMPVSEEIMQNVDSTEEATGITSNDISIEVMQESNVDLEGNEDNVEFETDSFSAWAITTNGTYTWSGNQTASAQEIASGLGDSIYFSVVADALDISTHAEGNVAIVNLGKCQNESLGNSANVYTHIGSFELSVTRTAAKAGTYNFAIYETADATGNPVHTFSINVPNDGGSSTYTVPLSAQNYSNLYVFELDKKGKPITDSGKYVSADKAAGNNSLFGSFSDNYVENIGSNDPGTVLQKVDGQTINLYVKSHDKVYRKTGSDVKDYPLNGSYPINVSSLLSKAYELSKKLAYLKNSDPVEVVNVKASTGTFREDVGNALNKDQNWLTNTGFSFGGKLLVINLDLSRYVDSGYTIMQFKANGKLTGEQWEEVANQIIINPVQKDSSGNYVPYTGTLTVQSASGTVVAPAANVNHDSGNHVGAIIAKYVNHSSGEIHKMTIHRYLTLKGNVTIKDDTTKGQTSLEFNLYKKINGSTENVSDTFSFTLERLVDNNRWVTVDNNVQNSGSNIIFKVDDISWNDGLKDMAVGQTYYFRFSENNLPSASAYTKDSSFILIKVKNFGTNNQQINYYRIAAYETGTDGKAVLDSNGNKKTNSEYTMFLATPSKATDYYNDAHRVKGEDIAFDNAKGGRLKLRKAWNYDSFKYPFVFVYVCARADGKDIPEESRLIQLGWENNWMEEITDLKTRTDKGKPIIYRVAEVNAVEANGNILGYNDVLARLNSGDHSLLVYDNGEEERNATSGSGATLPGSQVKISKALNGYVVSYSSTIGDMSSKYGGSSWQRVGLVDGISGEVTITNTQVIDFEVTKNWVLNGKEIPTADKIKVELWMQSANIADQPTGIEPELTTSDVTPTTKGADKAWKYTWKTLPCFDEKGESITYYVKETLIPEGFSSDAETAGKIVKTVVENYKNNETGCERLRTVSITNTAMALKLNMFKYLDNADPGTEKYDFWIRMYDAQLNQSKGSGMEAKHNIVTNNGSAIEYEIDPEAWDMQIGGTYYFIIREGAAHSDNKTECTMDSAIIIAKVVYTSVGSADIHYYKVKDKNDAALLIGNNSKAPELCMEEVSGMDVAFMNKTGKTMEISVVKEWDKLVGVPLTDAWTPDNIFDVTVKLYREGSNGVEEVGTKVISVSDNSTADSNKERLGGRGGYPEVWDYRSNPVVFEELAVKDENNREYRYFVKEFYNETELTLNGDTVNGYKLTDISEVKDGDNIVFTLHNTPYLIIEKEWTINGDTVDYESTSQFGTVFVNLYQSYRNSDSDSDYDGGLRIVQSTIALTYENHWTYETPVERKHDAVQQYVYYICECDSQGNDFAESNLVTYFDYNESNVTKLSDYRYEHGFTDRMNGGTSGTHVWRAAYVSGNNFPFIKLKVVNERSGYVLPSSGGIGTTGFYRIGMALVMIAFSGLIVMMVRKYGHRRS